MPQGEKSIYSGQIKATKVYRTEDREKRQLRVNVAKPDAMLLNLMANVKFTLLPFEYLSTLLLWAGEKAAM